MPFDPRKLENLRNLYSGAGGGEMRDSHFREVAAAIFKDGDRRKWPFADVATFLDAPYIADGLNAAVLDTLDVALIGVPMDLGVTNRAGARLGPRAVRAIDRVGPYEHVLRLAPSGKLKFADVGDVPMLSRFDLAQCHADIEACYRRIAETRAIPLSVGGDHSISGAILKGLAAKEPVGMIHIDAHCDTGDDYLGSRFHHGAPFRRAVEEGLLDPKRVIQIGIRGSLNHLDIWDFSRTSGMRVVTIEEFSDRGWRWAAEEAGRVVGDGPSYLSFDIDSLDPAFAPGTGTPESGGLTMLEAQRLIRELAALDLVGADVVEVSPPFDPSGVTALAAATILFESLCVLATAIARRRGKIARMAGSSPASG